MNKIIIFLILISIIINAQDQSQSQSIELPDFVITGKENISVPRIQKGMSEFIPLLSTEFFTPEFPGDKSTSIELPEVNTEIIDIRNNVQLTNSRLRFGAGLETWPSGDFYYNDWRGNLSYDLNIFGKNELEYVKNAGISYTGGSVGAKYFVDHNSKFLPGLEIGINGNYRYESFNFFRSEDPTLERITDNGYLDLNLNYVSGSNHSFAIGISDYYFNKRDLDLDENLFGTRAYYGLKLDNLKLRFEGNLKNQVLPSSSLSSPNEYYYNLKISVGLLLKEMINFKAGLYYAEKENNSFLYPTIFGSIKLNEYFSLYGVYSPDTEFKTLKDFYAANRYFYSDGIFNTMIENKTKLNFALKYEYEKYFEMSGGVGYVNADNNYYFEDNISEGIFNVHIVDTENSYLFFNFLFRKGPFGQFYADLKFQRFKGENNKKIPYQSNLIGKANYSYDWPVGFGIQLGLLYYGESFTDIENTDKIPEVFELNAILYYELFENFDLRLEFENLLDNKYYYFRNYNAKPFDILAGFEFRW